MTKPNEIKIDKNVPIPEAYAGITATLRKLKVGESFVTDAKRRYGIHGTAARAGVKIVTRVEGESGVRIWRIA